MDDQRPDRNAPGPGAASTDDELLDRYSLLVDELAVLPRDQLRERMPAVLQGLSVCRTWLEAMHEPGRPRKPQSLVACFVSLAERFRILAVKAEVVGLVTDANLLPGEPSGSWMELHPLNLR